MLAKDGRRGKTMPELEVERLSLRFGGLTVLDSISLAVEAGELLALIGPNGAGKTSLFNCVSGLYRPEGAIRFRGQNILGKQPHEIARLGIARTFQHGEIFPQMTVIDNLMTGRHACIKSNPLSDMFHTAGMRREEANHRKAVEDVLRFVELENYRDLPVGSLPFGLQKVVGFARALAAEPLILLLDEPSAGLTREEREDLAYSILKIKETLGIGMIWIEHDMQMVADIADRIHVLDYGRTLADGVPKEVLNCPEVIRAYLGTMKQSPALTIKT
jgi:branched-chain amino acid transport system ATP-binding protein